jgi:hypothetical protein
VRRVWWNSIVKVHQLDDIDEDRRSEWIATAADRERFRQRIQNVSVLLEPVLNRQFQRYLDFVADSECTVLDCILKGELY